MNNQQLYLAIGLPTLASLGTLAAVILAWITGRSDVSSLRTEMISMRRNLHNDMTAFRKEIHEDLMLLHERVVKVEARQS